VSGAFTVFVLSCYAYFIFLIHTANLCVDVNAAVSSFYLNWELFICSKSVDDECWEYTARNCLLYADVCL